MGDCIKVESTAPMRNSAELCLRVDRNYSDLARWDISDYTGIVLDFARRIEVPKGYNLTKLSSSPPIDVAIANQAWLFESNPTYGRIKSGWTLFKALNVTQNITFRQNDSFVCAPIFGVGSYCPVARLDA